MIKRKGFIVFLITLLIISLIVPAGASGPIRIIVDGNVLSTDVAPVLEGGRTLVPIRAISEHLGAQVDYNTQTKTIKINSSTVNVTLNINQPIAYIGNRLVELDVAPKIISSRTMVPLRFVGEALGCKVDWFHTEKVVQITTVYVSPADPSGYNWSAMEKEIFDLVNQTRRDYGLVPLLWMPELADVARAHNNDMADNSFFNHSSPRTGSPNDRAKAIGLPGMGENIAAGYLDAKSVHQAWMMSPGHRANILNPDYRFIGVGYLRKTTGQDAYGGRYFTQNFVLGDAVFLRPLPSSKVTQPMVFVQGYATQPDLQVTVYKLIDDPHGSNIIYYSDTYKVPVAVVDTKFSQEIPLNLGKGKYVVQASDQDARHITYE